MQLADPNRKLKHKSKGSRAIFFFNKKDWFVDVMIWFGLGITGGENK